MANLFIISESIPSNPVDGLCWYKPTISQVYMYINSGWRVWTGGNNLITFDLGLNIFIRGIKRNLKILNESFEKQDKLTYLVDTCSFILEDDDGTAIPSQGDEVLIFWKESASSTPTKLFGGEISRMPQMEYGEGVGQFRYNIQCVDYQRRLKKRRVTQDYTSQTAQAIIQDIVDTYATEFSYNNVEVGPTISFISFNYKPADACIKEIAKLSGYDWYVDENRDIHFFQSVTNLAPYTITDDITTSGSHRGLIIDVDKSQYRNRVIVQGGFFYSSNYEQTIVVADNDEDTWGFTYKPFAGSGSITCKYNGGAATIGIENLDTGKDFYYNQAEKTLVEGDQATVATDVIKVTYQYKVPVLTQDDDENSIATIQAIEGGDGIYEYKITDKTINTIQAAHDRSAAILSQYANPIITGSFTTKNSGYRSGQLLTINAPSRGVNATNKTYLIQSVITTVLAGTVLEYTIVFATRLKGLTEFLTELYDGSLINEIIVRDNQTLDILVIPSDEEFAITTSSEDVDIGLPFEWGAGGDRQMKWVSAVTDVGSATGIWGKG